MDTQKRGNKENMSINSLYLFTRNIVILLKKKLSKFNKDSYLFY